METFDEPKLKREAGLFQLVAYGVGNIIGAGIYVLVGAGAGLAGASLWLAFLIGAIVALFTGLSYAELSAMYPKAASEYTYLGRAYGNRFIAFITEWMMLATEIVAAATVALGFAEYFQVLHAFPIPIVAAALLVFLTIVSIIGVKQSLRLNTLLSAVAIIGLIIVIAAGIPRLGSVSYTYSPNGITGIFGAAILVFFAYVGFDNIANLSEETKDPRRTLPRGLLISIAITTLLYVLVGLATVSLVPWQQLAASDAPLALAASVTLGPVAYDVLTAAALLTTLNTVLVLLIVGSRIVYGMARAGALPKILGYINKRTDTPIVASIAVLAVALLFLPIGKVSIVAKITSFGSLITFAVVNIALLHLRKIAPSVERPFRAPLNIGWISVTAILGAVSCIALLTQFDWLSITLGLMLPLSGTIIHIVRNRKHEDVFEVDRRVLEHVRKRK